MALSLNVFNVPPEQLGQLARHAESLGFERMWFGDHLIAPLSARSRHPRSDAATARVLYERTPLNDLMVLFAHLGAQTKRIELATGVLILPLRQPVTLARAVATAQLLTRGRIVLGIGAGWLREEFDVVGVPFEGRGRRMEEMIEIMQALWTGERVHHEGDIWRFEDVQLWPPPDPAIPLVLGGVSPVALARAAQRAEGWYSPSNVTLEEVLRCREVIEGHRHRLGAERPFRYHVRLPAGEEASAIERYRPEGFTDLVVPMTDVWRRSQGLTAEERCSQLSEVAASIGMVASGEEGQPRTE